MHKKNYSGKNKHLFRIFQIKSNWLSRENPSTVDNIEAGGCLVCKKNVCYTGCLDKKLDGQEKRKIE